MKSLVILSALLSSTVLANTSLEQLSVLDEVSLNNERGMYLIYDDQDNISVQGGYVDGSVKNSSTGFTQIQGGAFSGSHGIMMIHQGSGNNNVTNMSTNVNIISVH